MSQAIMDICFRQASLKYTYTRQHRICACKFCPTIFVPRLPSLQFSSPRDGPYQPNSSFFPAFLITFKLSLTTLFNFSGSCLTLRYRNVQHKAFLRSLFPQG
ncbi:hypothetical protein J3459_015952 [Metarhizium acridum]|nr:hypothetical protein J3459_015952 [Metarhizium acridum]